LRIRDKIDLKNKIQILLNVKILETTLLTINNVTGEEPLEKTQDSISAAPEVFLKVR
jgi:hypothetical protein